MRKPWTDKEVETLRRLYPDVLCKEIARQMGRCITSIYGMANKLELHKSEAFKESEYSGRITKLLIKGAEYRYKKGHKPFNKGLPMGEFMSPETQQKFSLKTFRKGHIPHNTKKDGQISMRRDNNGYTYKFIRTSLGVWEALHVYNWEKQNGPVPDGFIVVFKTPDKINCEISNLELITREDNMRRNTIHRYPDELKTAIRTLNKLNREIHGKE